MNTAEKKAKIKELEEMLAQAKLPATHKDYINIDAATKTFTEGKIKKLTAEVKEEEKTPAKPATAKPAAPAPKPAEKKSEPKKAAPAKPAPAKAAPAKPAPAKVAPKKIAPAKKKDEDDDTPSCEELIAAYEKRVKAQEKAAKKHKTTSISTSIGKNFASIMNKAIKNYPTDKIKKSPEEFRNKVKDALGKVKDAIASLRALLGKDFDKEDFNEELSAVMELEKKLENKYKE